MEEVIDADRVIVMDDGKIVMDGTPSEVFSKVEELKALQLDVPQVTELQAQGEPVRQETPAQKPEKLFLKLPSEDSLEYRKAKACLNMFPGQTQAVLYFADTGVRRGTAAQPAEELLEELRSILGPENVVLK